MNQGQMLSNIANVLFYEQIVVKLSILSQTISDSDDVEVIEVMKRCSDSDYTLPNTSQSLFCALIKG